MATSIEVEVAYAPAPHQVDLTTVTLPGGSTVADAIAASGILTRHPELEIGGRNKVGIYAKAVTLETPLRDRDRVEIYRPILVDPKTVRRKKSAQKAGRREEAEQV